MTSHHKSAQKNPIVSTGIITLNETGKLEIAMQGFNGAPQKVLLSPWHIRQIVEFTVSETGEAIACLVDTKMPISQKVRIAIPPANENGITTRIVSVDQLVHNGRTFPIVGYTGIMSDKAIAIASALAPLCASIGGGYFSNRGLLADTKTWVGGITVPLYFKNMRVVRRKNQQDTIIFSAGCVFQEISIANMLAQKWTTAETIMSRNDTILFVGRPSVQAEKAYVVTKKHILTFDLKSHAVEIIQSQPSDAAEIAVAFFREGDRFISLTNAGASVDLTAKAA